MPSLLVTNHSTAPARSAETRTEPRKYGHGLAHQDRVGGGAATGGQDRLGLSKPGEPSDGECVRHVQSECSLVRGGRRRNVTRPLGAFAASRLLNRPPLVCARGLHAFLRAAVALHLGARIHLKCTGGLCGRDEGIPLLAQGRGQRATGEQSGCGGDKQEQRYEPTGVRSWGHPSMIGRRPLARQETDEHVGCR